MMASTTFLLQLQNYPKDSINDEMIDFLQPYFAMEDYNMDMARRVCGDVAGLLFHEIQNSKLVDAPFYYCYYIKQVCYHGQKRWDSSIMSTKKYFRLKLI